MKTKVLTLSVCLFFLSVSLGCNESNIIKKKGGSIENITPTLTDDNKSTIENWLVRELPSCKLLFDNNIESMTEEMIVLCFSYATAYQAPLNTVDYIGSKLLTESSTKDLLTKVLKVIAEGSSRFTSLTKLLIKRGASTKNISLQYVLNGNSINCNTSMVILKNNEELYRDSFTIKNKGSEKTDLHFLVDTGSGRGICEDVIQLLAGYNPTALNIQNKIGYTPLHLFFSGHSRHPEINSSLAISLMTPINVNLRDSRGNTPLHTLILYNKPQKTDLPLIKSMLRIGADLTLKNNKSNEQSKTESEISVKDLILKKRPDLISLLR